jgi:hypothetical protein
MARRYFYSTCLMFGTDGEADHVELDVTVSFTVAWGSPESGRYGGPPEDYDPGSPDEVEDVQLVEPTGLSASNLADVLSRMEDDVHTAAMAEIAREADAADAPDDR